MSLNFRLFLKDRFFSFTETLNHEFIHRMLRRFSKPFLSNIRIDFGTERTEIKKMSEKSYCSHLLLITWTVKAVTCSILLWNGSIFILGSSFHDQINSLNVYLPYMCLWLNILKKLAIPLISKKPLLLQKAVKRERVFFPIDWCISRSNAAKNERAVC